MKHPVVLGNTKSSRWTAFLSPDDEDEEEAEVRVQDWIEEISTTHNVSTVLILAG